MPDNQEVLLGLEDNTTVIVEVLESVKEGNAKDNIEEAIRYVAYVSGNRILVVCSDEIAWQLSLCLSCS